MPHTLTIGFFDGVHLGHQALLSRADTCVTFSGHPSSTLHPEEPLPLITSHAHRLALIKPYVQDIHILDFTTDLATQDPKTFLTSLPPFDHLLLGHDARLGKDRSGTPEVLQEIATAHNFILEYLPPVLIDNAPVSSSRIRLALREGDLVLAEELLGRPYSIMGTVLRGAGHGDKIGYPTANLDLTGLSHPPFGVYAITLTADHADHPGIANLGVAPTLQHNRKPLLEAHLFDVDHNLYDKTVEVTLHTYLRPEQKFNSPEALKAQIAQDITRTKSILNTKEKTRGISTT